MPDDTGLHWNDEAAICAACGRSVAPRAGYHVYGPDGDITLCAACYQRRLTADDGGPTHDLAAEVDGGSG